MSRIRSRSVATSAEPRGAQPLVLRHHQHVVEELRNRRLQRCNRWRRPRGSRRARRRRESPARATQSPRPAPFRPAPSACRRRSARRSRRRHALRDVLHALEQRRHTQQRGRPGHLRQRLELAPRLERTDVARSAPCITARTLRTSKPRCSNKYARRSAMNEHSGRGGIAGTPPNGCRGSFQQRPERQRVDRARSAPAGRPESSPRPAPDAAGRADRASRSAARRRRTCRRPNRACRRATTAAHVTAAAAELLPRTAAPRLRRRPAGSGSRSPSRRLRAALPRGRRCRPSCPAAR